MSDEIIKPIEFMEKKRFRLPIRFRTDKNMNSMSIDVSAYTIEEAINDFLNNKDKYVPLPPKHDSPCAYTNQETIMNIGELDIDDSFGDGSDIIMGLNNEMERNEKFKDLKFIDCGQFAY